MSVLKFNLNIPEIKMNGEFFAYNYTLGLHQDENS